jgi:outer membrane protein OmpA-like peptidoglycan-associated protein
VADSTKDHRPAWLPLAAAAVVVPTALAGLTLLWPRPQVETELTSAGTAALAAAGFSSAGLTLNGRDATITGIPAADQQRAIDAVQAVTGVRVATVSGPAAGGGTAPAPTSAVTAPPAQAAPFGIARSGDDIVLTGVVGSEDQRAQFIAAATAQAGGKKIIDKLTVTAGAQPPSVVSVSSIGALVAAMAKGPADLAVTISGTGVKITGTVADAATKTALGTAIGGALAGSTVDNQLTVGGGGAAGGLDAAATEKLRTSLASLLAGSPILFEPNSPQLTASGRATVAKVLALLKPAPGAKLQVDGYVATGPGDGRLTAKQLSDQRAATVRDALVAGGVPAGQIAATGKGEDTTSTTKALGRRVAITVV